MDRELKFLSLDFSRLQSDDPLKIGEQKDCGGA